MTDKNRYVVRQGDKDITLKFNVGNTIKMAESLGEDPIQYVLSGVPNDKMLPFGKAIITGCANGEKVNVDELENDILFLIVNAFVGSFIPRSIVAGESDKDTREGQAADAL